MVSRRIVLRFSKQIWEEPVVCFLGKNFDLTFNILKAEVTQKEEGVLVLELWGPEAEFKKGMKFLKLRGVKVEPLSQDIIRNEAKCTHCGTCLAVCPTKSLYLDRSSWLVRFDPQKCIGCELCIPACPPRAMEMEY
jgi:ferredoxin